MGPIETVKEVAETVGALEYLTRIAEAVEKRNTLSETLARGLSANGVLFSGIVRTRQAPGVGRHQSSVPYACLIVSDPQGAGPIYVSNDDSSQLTVQVGAGIWEVPKNGREVIPMTGRDVWLYTPSTLTEAGINLCILTIPPYRVVAL